MQKKGRILHHRDKTRNILTLEKARPYISFT